MPIPFSSPGKRSNEDVFFSYYPTLLEWAFQITHHDREEAEDLVHDLYLRVIRIARSMDAIENRESYLFKILRNLYYSRLRRAGRDPINDVSIIDYDTVEYGLASVDRRQLLFARSHLKQICRYVCERKSAVRSASVLILRYFLGYYPSELMKVLQSSRSSIDKALYVARNEARFSLERPSAIRCILPGTLAPLSLPEEREGEGTEELFLELREAIFEASEGECFGRSALEQWYAVAGAQAEFTAPELAHLVSCKTCLDQVNAILHLPLLKDRSPEYGFDRDDTSGPRSAGGQEDAAGTHRKGSSGKLQSRRKLERHARLLFEHRPQRLQIAVDGEVRTCQKVSAETSELHLKLAHKEEPAFIEIFSEQGCCLAYLQVDEPSLSPSLEQVETVHMSDDRSLLLTLSFAAEVPIVHVVYFDPVVAQEAEAAQFERGDTAENHTRVEAISIAETKSKFPIFGRTDRGRRLRNSVFTWLRLCSGHIPAIPMNPLLATSTLFAIAAIACFLLWMRSGPSISATALLQRAEVVDRSPVTSSTPGVVYQKVRIKTALRSIDRSIYRDTSGSRKPKPHSLDLETAKLQTKLVSAGVDWNEPLSAASYRNWHDHRKVTRDSVQETGKNLLTLTTSTTDANVIEESLTVRAIDFHPVARTITFRDAHAVEIAELDYAVLPWADAPSGWFEPTAELTTASDARFRTPSFHHSSRRLTEAEIDEAELDAILALHQLHADVDNRMQVIRSANGVQVKGIVETDVRKHEMEARLNLISNVIPSIFTFQDLQRQSALHPESGMQSTHVALAYETEQVSPLEKYFLSKGESRDKISRLANRISDSSNIINQESGLLAKVLTRYSPNQQLTEGGRATLNELIVEHKTSILAALKDEEHSLVEAGLMMPSSPDSTLTNIDITESTERNRKLCEELVFGDSLRGRSAQEILPELARTIHQLHIAALQLKALPSAPTSARKEQ